MNEKEKYITGEIFDGQIFDIKVTINNGALEFSYSIKGENFNPCSDIILVKEKSILLFNLIRTEDSPRGIKFSGIVKNDPFSKVIDEVLINKEGDQLLLEDLCKDDGEVESFQFLFTSEEFSSYIISPDPQVLNKRSHN